jgi:hypothetical protein
MSFTTYRGSRVNKMSEGVGRTWTFYVEISTTSAY